MEITLKRTNQEIQNKVKELYLSGVPQIKIEELLKMTRSTIRKILLKENLLRDKSEAFRLSKSGKINNNAFEKLTEESLYWIGFLYADGYISNKDYSIQLALKNEDENHLQKFLDFLQSNSRITNYNKGKAKRVRIYSKQIQNRLKYFGFDNNKSFTAIPHEELKNSRDFWRGVIDGDGSLSNQRDYIKIHLCGTFNTIVEFLKFLSKDFKPWKANGKELYQTSFISNDAKQIADLLYKDSKIYLERKYQKYLQDFAN